MEFKEYNDYRLLLDNLKYAYENYGMDREGIVYNLKGEKVTNERVISNRRFSILYCLGYRTTMGMKSGNPIENIDDNYINQALNDYRCFNTFMNIIVNYGYDYANYSIDFDAEQIISYIIRNKARRTVLKEYLKCEAENIANIQKKQNKGIRR